MTTTTYIPTRDKTKAIKAALIPVFGRTNVSVVKGTGTASHWITSTVKIDRHAGCTNDCKYWPNCDLCRAIVRDADDRVRSISAKALRDMGADFGHYYSDDYSDPTPHNCHLINVRVKD